MVEFNTPRFEKRTRAQDKLPHNLMDRVHLNLVTTTSLSYSNENGHTQSSTDNGKEMVIILWIAPQPMVIYELYPARDSLKRP